MISLCLTEDLPAANQQSKTRNALTLALFVFRVDANHPHHTLAVNDLALVTHFLNRSTDFHLGQPSNLSAGLAAVIYSDK